ncbi:MAG: hypothetical protein OHK0053_24270 [Microscillaceae bacterium]
MKKLILFILFGFWASLLWAQNGSLYLKTYQPPGYGPAQAAQAILQVPDGTMLFAHPRGLWHYDGVQWNLILLNDAPQTLELDETFGQRIFVGGIQSFGYLERDAWGRWLYIKISEANRRFGAIRKIVRNDGYAFFYSDQVIYRVSLRTRQVEKIWIARPAHPFAGIFVHQGRVFVPVFNQGLHRLAGNEMVKASPQGWPKLAYINTAFSLSPSQTLLGTTGSQLYSFESQHLQTLPLEAEAYLQEHLLTGGRDLSGPYFALATLTGGALLIDKKTLRVAHTLSYQTGLPDDEIKALGTDQYGGLWLATEYGISRADLSLPLENFGDFPGLEGRITAVAWHQNILYVGTTIGLFQLRPVKDPRQLITIVRQREEKLTEVKTTIDRTLLITKYEEISRTERLYRTIFGNPDKQKKAERLRKKEERRQERQDKRKSNPADTAKDLENDPLTTTERSSSLSKERTEGPTQTETFYEYDGQKMSVRYALQSIPFVFEQLTDVKGKCHQLRARAGRLGVATNLGYFEIQNGQTTWLLRNQEVLDIWHNAQQQTYLATRTGLFFKTNANARNFEKAEALNARLLSLAGQGNALWLAGEQEIYGIDLDAQGRPRQMRRYQIPALAQKKIALAFFEQKPWVFAGRQVYGFDARAGQWQLSGLPLWQHLTQVLIAPDGHPWLQQRGQWRSLSAKAGGSALYLSLFEDLQGIYTDPAQNTWLITHQSLYRLRPAAHPYPGQGFPLLLRAIRDRRGKTLKPENLVLDYTDNALRIELAAPFFLQEGTLSFRYRIEGFTSEWSAWHHEPLVSFPILPPGRYQVYLQARNALGQTSRILAYSFQVRPPFWQKSWFYLLGALGLIALGAGLLAIRTLALQRAKKRLEHKVMLKTQEIAAQKQQLEVALEEIAKKNRDITSSIRYARRIQEAILPFETELQSLLPNYCLFYQPRDLVSGDFYWVTQKEGYVFVMVADCTGHGVPGAFMSMIGHALLSEIVNEKNVLDPAQILHQLDQGIVKALKQDDPRSQRSDGMDVGICRIEASTREIVFAGANHALYWVSGGKSHFQPGNRYGIGGLQKGEKKFNNHTLLLPPDTELYLSTDGYLDQFGGPQQKKFMRSRFLRLIAESLYGQPRLAKQACLAQTFAHWKASRSQIDDVLVLGFSPFADVSLGQGE